MLIEKTEYTNPYKTNFFFFKDIDYIQLDDFSKSDLTLPEGEKTNGYTNLTNTPKVVNQNFLNYQMDTINQIMTEQYYNNWPSTIDEIASNYVGMAKITTQFGSSERERKEFLLDSVQFMGETNAELESKKNEYSDLNTGQVRDVTLSGLHMISTGYVYTTLSSMEKVISESSLPYIDTNFLKTAGKIEKQNETVLKIVNNDHVFAAFSIPKKATIDGEEEVLADKEEYMGTRGPEKNSEYYKFLVKRVDQVRYYPKLSFKEGGNLYNGYLVDIVDDGENKIAVMMIRDYVNVFSNEIMINTEINIQRFDCYKVPQSAIVKKDEKTYVKTLEKGYFEDLIEVDINKYEKGMAILSLDSEKNKNLSSGMTIKIYP
ncbi:MAG: hypothetical protein RR564_02530 [Eubacterium sp.]